MRILDLRIEVQEQRFIGLRFDLGKHAAHRASIVMDPAFVVASPAWYSGSHRSRLPKRQIAIAGKDHRTPNKSQTLMIEIVAIQVIHRHRLTGGSRPEIQSPVGKESVPPDIGMRHVVQTNLAIVVGEPVRKKSDVESRSSLTFS